MTVGVKRAMPLVIPVVADRLADSAVLSNLGRIPDPPWFDGSDPAAEPSPELWFSPPCSMPIGVGVGVATVGGALHLTVRYGFAQFDRGAANDFAEAFLRELGVGRKPVR
jgi:NRPS condensation-like uncharacterized protein